MAIAKFMAFGLMLASGSTSSKPTYLKCMWQERSGELEEYFIINEAGGSVTSVILKTRNFTSMNGIFHTDRIDFNDSIIFYRINRKDLSALRYLRPSMDTQSGRCQVVSKSKSQPGG